MTEMPCIRCGDCAQACPRALQPQQLLADLRAGDPLLAREHGLDDCSLCGECDLVCPSQIALSARFSVAALALVQDRVLMQRAEPARLRFEARARRLQRESDERAEREARLVGQAASPDAVAAAIERARLRRLTTRSPP